MMWSIERLRRRLSVASVMPLALLIGSVHPTDPMRKSRRRWRNRYADQQVLQAYSRCPARRSIQKLRVASTRCSISITTRGPTEVECSTRRVTLPKQAAPAKNHHRQCSDHVASARGNSNTPNS